MKKRIFVFAVLIVCAAVIFAFSCFSVSAQNAAKDYDGAGTTYATLPHETLESSETFVTVFTVAFMIILAALAAFAMYFKR